MRTGIIDVLGYAPPEFHETKAGAYIDYYIRSEIPGKPQRKRIKLNAVPKGTRKLVARQMVAELTRKLQDGWRPGDPEDIVRHGITVAEALDLWDRVKARQLRHSSPYSYTSMTNMLRNWCVKDGCSTEAIHHFGRQHAVRFMAYVSDERLVGNRTYNNYLMYFRMLFSWLVERRHIKADPFEGLSKRKEPRKSRTYITEQEREQMALWIQENDPLFWLPCMLVYGTLIRPGEIARLRVHHVDLERQVVNLPAEVTKSGTERTPAIPDWMAAELRAMELHKQPGKAWLLGNRIYPGDKPIARNTLNRRWTIMRKALGWPNTKQLYSLRDTGIIQLIRDGVDLLHVRDQAGHTDIATTNGYLKHAFPNGPAEVRVKGTSLQASSPFAIGKPMALPEEERNKPIPRFATRDLDTNRPH